MIIQQRSNRLQISRIIVGFRPDKTDCVLNRLDEFECDYMRIYTLFCSHLMGVVNKPKQNIALSVPRISLVLTTTSSLCARISREREFYLNVLTVQSKKFRMLHMRSMICNQ